MTEEEKIQKAEWRLQGDRCRECNRRFKEFDHATGCSIAMDEFVEEMEATFKKYNIGKKI